MMESLRSDGTRLKYVSMVDLVLMEIAPYIDQNPDARFCDVADEMNRRGYRNKRGRLINKNSISWALGEVFPDQRYRRHDKCSKKGYEDQNRPARIIHENQEEIQAEGVLVDTVTEIQYVKSTPPKYGEAVKTEKPSSISVKDVVETHLQGEDARKFWDAEPQWDAIELVQESKFTAFFKLLWFNVKELFA